MLSLWERPKCLPLHLQRSQLISGSTTSAPSIHEVMGIRLRHVALLALEHRLQDISGLTIRSEVIVSSFSEFYRSILLTLLSIWQYTSSCSLQRPFRPQDFFRSCLTTWHRPELQVCVRNWFTGEFDTVGTLHRSLKDAKHLITATMEVSGSSQVQRSTAFIRLHALTFEVS